MRSLSLRETELKSTCCDDFYRRDVILYNLIISSFNFLSCCAWLLTKSRQTGKMNQCPCHALLQAGKWHRCQTNKGRECVCWVERTGYRVTAENDMPLWRMPHC